MEREKHVKSSSQRRVVAMQRPRGPAAKDLEGLLSSAMIAGDKQLGHLVHEIDQIVKALGIPDADPKTLRESVHPAVWYAVKHVLIERELRHLALTDDLTCIYNRRGFFAAATQQLKVARRNSACMLLFFCDLDNLKHINDSLGHREGDRALVRTADVLESVFRDSDILARIGGDEFAALAGEASGRDETTILGRLDEALARANADEPRYTLCLSTGVSRFDPLGTENLGDLMSIADRAMYEKKRSKQPPFPRRA